MPTFFKENLGPSVAHEGRSWAPGPRHFPRPGSKPANLFSTLTTSLEVGSSARIQAARQADGVQVSLASEDGPSEPEHMDALQGACSMR